MENSSTIVIETPEIVIGTPESVIGSHKNVTETVSEEQAMMNAAKDAEQLAESFTISNQAEYEQAAELAKDLKTKAHRVTEYFKPLKDAAHKAHRLVCDREKEMLAPLNAADKALKNAMAQFDEMLRKKALRMEIENRKAIQAEAQALLQKAAELERAGQIEAASLVMQEAEIIDEADCTVVAPAIPKVNGVSSKKDWEITGIDASKVPVELNGMVIRPVDEKAIIKLIRASKGSIRIPGITYKETTKISVRRN